jgi:hypothetical protein
MGIFTRGGESVSILVVLFVDFLNMLNSITGVTLDMLTA